MGESCLQSGFKWGSTAAHEDSSGKSSLMAQPRDRPAPYGRCTMERGKLRVRGENYNNSPNQFFPPPSVCEVQFVLIHHRKKKKKKKRDMKSVSSCSDMWADICYVQGNTEQPVLQAISRNTITAAAAETAANMQPLTPETTLEERWEFLHRAVMRYCAAEVTDSQWFAALSWC